MLTKQLKTIKRNLQSQKEKLTKSQRQLLHELNFLDRSDIVELAYDTYSYEEEVLESFAVASALCPACGKKI